MDQEPRKTGEIVNMHGIPWPARPANTSPAALMSAIMDAIHIHGQGMNIATILGTLDLCRDEIKYPPGE